MKDRVRVRSKKKDLGFMALSRICHLYRADGSSEVGRKYPEKNHLTYQCKTWHLKCVLSEAQTTAVRITETPNMQFSCKNKSAAGIA